MIFEYQTRRLYIDAVDAYLNAMDVEDWELCRFEPTPLGAHSLNQDDYQLHILLLHRRSIEPEKEAAHIAQVRRLRKAA